MNRAPARCLAAIAVFALAGHAEAGDGRCAVQSGPARATLVELYTSEGCSSCPPADRWLARLADPVARGRVVPLAFHVDYWDDLGWKDRFADAAWSERQRRSVRRAGGRTVYTPQVMLDGRDFPRWYGMQPKDLATAVATRAKARLGLALTMEPAALAVSVDVAPVGEFSGSEVLVLALAESGLSSMVRNGENSGRTLVHDHVVRLLAPAVPLGAEGGRFRHAFTLLPEWRRKDLAVVAYVQEAGSGEVLQALRLPACPA